MGTYIAGLPIMPGKSYPNLTGTSADIERKRVNCRIFHSPFANPIGLPIDNHPTRQSFLNREF
jgi:hypothetical protein